MHILSTTSVMRYLKLIGMCHFFKCILRNNLAVSLYIELHKRKKACPTCEKSNVYVNVKSIKFSDKYSRTPQNV